MFFSSFARASGLVLTLPIVWRNRAVWRFNAARIHRPASETDTLDHNAPLLALEDEPRVATTRCER